MIDQAFLKALTERRSNRKFRPEQITPMPFSGLKRSLAASDRKNTHLTEAPASFKVK